MKRIAMVSLSLLLCAVLAAGAAADSLSLNGSVAAAGTTEVYAPIGGTVAAVNVVEGQTVSEGDVLLTLKTAKVYAEEDGTVTGIFGEPGDSCETVSGRYGAVMYIEGATAYTVSASTENAYNSASTRFVHVGETVYLECRSNNDRTGEGRITAISGTSYTVEVISGTFIPGDSVNIYRDSAYTAGKRVGRGTVARRDPIAVTGSGSIVSLAVKDGDRVSRGDLLFETLDGAFDGLWMSGSTVTASSDGVVGTINAPQGTSIQKGSVAAVLYAEGSMRVEAEVPEDSLNDIAVGDSVIIELESDESRTFDGTVTMISAIAGQSASGEVTYKALISFTPDDSVRYGMSVIVNTPEKEEEEPEEDQKEAEEEEREETEKAETDESAEAAGKPARDGAFPAGFDASNLPEGFDPGNMPAVAERPAAEK